MVGASHDEAIVANEAMKQSLRALHHLSISSELLCQGNWLILATLCMGCRWTTVQLATLFHQQNRSQFIMGGGEKPSSRGWTRVYTLNMKLICPG